MDGNADTQRFTATLNIGTVTTATTKDVTFAVAGSTTTPGAIAATSDLVLLAPLATNLTGVAMSDVFVSAAGVITARFNNTTTANVAVGTAVAYQGVLIKGTGSI